MTRRSPLGFGGIALAVIVTVTVTGCSTRDTNSAPTLPTDAPISERAAAALGGASFDVHRDPG